MVHLAPTEHGNYLTTFPRFPSFLIKFGVKYRSVQSHIYVQYIWKKSRPMVLFSYIFLLFYMQMIFYLSPSPTACSYWMAML